MGTKWGPKDSFGSPLGPMWCMNVGMGMGLSQFWQCQDFGIRALSIVASRIYALFVAKSTSVPGLEGKTNLGNARILEAPVIATPPFKVFHPCRTF